MLTQYQLYISTGRDDFETSHRVTEFFQEVSRQFDAFTVVESTGYWEGEEERSMVLTIITRQDRQGVDHLAARACAYFNQASTLVTVSYPALGTLIDRHGKKKQL